MLADSYLNFGRQILEIVKVFLWQSVSHFCVDLSVIVSCPKFQFVIADTADFAFLSELNVF